MDKKIIFLDIDGTIVDYNNTIPASAKQAIERARANGHYVLICTGRASSQLGGPAAELELDGKVCSAGGYVEIDGRIIKEKYMTKEEVAFITNYLEENKICYCLESPNGSFVCKRTKTYFKGLIADRVRQYPEEKEAIEKGMQVFVESMIEDADMTREDIMKVTFFGSNISFEEMTAAFKDRFELLPNSVKMAGENSGEIMMSGIHKATGIKVVLEYLNLDQKNSFAYGDGLNDMEMLEFAAHGIAMGNACEELKKVASDVTDAVGQDGLYNSFKKYGLI